MTMAKQRSHMQRHKLSKKSSNPADIEYRVMQESRPNTQQRIYEIGGSFSRERTLLRQTQSNQIIEPINANEMRAAPLTKTLP